MLKIKGIEKLLSVNPHLRGIEEWNDRYRLHILSDASELPLLLDIHKILNESGDISIRLNVPQKGDVFLYNSFPMNCSIRTFSDISTFSQYYDILIGTWRTGGLSGSQYHINILRPKGNRIDIWS